MLFTWKRSLNCYITKRGNTQNILAAKFLIFCKILEFEFIVNILFQHFWFFKNILSNAYLLSLIDIHKVWSALGVESRTKTERTMKSQKEKGTVLVRHRSTTGKLHPCENERYVHPVWSTTTYPRDTESTLAQSFPLSLSLSLSCFSLVLCKVLIEKSFIGTTISCPLRLCSYWSVITGCPV